VGEDRSRPRAEIGAVLSSRPIEVDAPTPEGAGAFYGRRKGKQLRPGQHRLVEELLPRLRIESASGPLDPGSLFPFVPSSITLEIGFGGGEHLATRARAHPDVGFIGCEPFVNGMAKLLAAIDDGKLRNIRLWDQDATGLIARLPEGSIDQVYLLYPDPWPKRRQRKRRFISDEHLSSLARLMRAGAELRFATDIDDYAGWALARVLRSSSFTWKAERPDDWRQPWTGWPSTRYEAKARREGRGSAYLTFTRAYDGACSSSEPRSKSPAL
jgi:tRNA (guanine-N7-)-methyltransferase